MCKHRFQGKSAEIGNHPPPHFCSLGENPPPPSRAKIHQRKLVVLAVPLASTYVPTKNGDIETSTSDVNVTSNGMHNFDAIIARLKCVY